MKLQKYQNHTEVFVSLFWRLNWQSVGLIYMPFIILLTQVNDSCVWYIISIYSLLLGNSLLLNMFLKLSQENYQVKRKRCYGILYGCGELMLINSAIQLTLFNLSFLFLKVTKLVSKNKNKLPWNNEELYLNVEIDRALMLIAKVE